VEAGAAAAARAGAFGAAPPVIAPPVIAQPAAGWPGAAYDDPVRDGAVRNGTARFDLRPGQADPLLITERDWARAMRAAALPAAGPSCWPGRPRRTSWFSRMTTTASSAMTCRR